VTGPRAKAVLADMMAGNSAPVEHLATAVDGGGGEDEAALELLCTQVLAEHPKQAAQYRAGRDKMMGLFVGQVMQRTKGKADPVAATALFERLLRL
jgi:aspartyl-tRNA(Asn)/glutamyl-tRNA(Gln) amidotransferase subunit B